MDSITAQTGLLDLPVDLLLMIFPYLDVKSFLSLSSTCTALHKPEFLLESSYWSSITRATFRVPNQPVVQNDGQRWQRLYKRLLTQTRVYTWGHNEKACLGHSYESPHSVNLAPPALRRARAMRSRHVSWPTEMAKVEELGVISDMQCGGWSTTLLTAKGALYTVGVLDGSQYHQRRPPYMQKTMVEPVALRYPPGYPQPCDRYEPTVAVQQFSAGRGHVLALSDSGRIWSWSNIEHGALHVKFLHADIKETGVNGGSCSVKKVVAGWNKSSALVAGTGIVLWDPLQRAEGEAEDEDAALILQTCDVPNTSYRTFKTNKQQAMPQISDLSIAEEIGEVVNYIVLENFVLLNTHLGKVFASKITWTDRYQEASDLVEIPLVELENEFTQDEAFASDVQGSFRSFAIFTRSGNVLTGNQDHLNDRWNHYFTPPGALLNPISGLARIAALQKTSVIQMAFGDYHYHALHAPGHITSYGTESEGCGSLGLGGHGDPEGRLRGIRYSGIGRDGNLVPHAYTSGRRVWFEEEKRQWIRFLTSGGVDPQEAQERIRMAIGSPDIRCQGEVSEWIEQEGRDWESKLNIPAGEDDGLGAYFALSVTAAGWHSGALVLANGEIAKKVKDACVVDETPERKDIVEEGTTLETEAENGQGGGLLNTIINTAYDYGRWFLGLPPYQAGSASSSMPSNTTAQHYQGATSQLGDFARGTHPLNYGASPRVGRKYVWADDHFPRLQLSDGREMPGDVAFNEWRYGRPEWDLSTG